MATWNNSRIVVKYWHTKLQCIYELPRGYSRYVERYCKLVIFSEGQIECELIPKCFKKIKLTRIAHHFNRSIISIQKDAQRYIKSVSWIPLGSYIEQLTHANVKGHIYRYFHLFIKHFSVFLSGSSYFPLLLSTCLLASSLWIIIF